MPAKPIHRRPAPRRLLALITLVGLNTPAFGSEPPATTPPAPPAAGKSAAAPTPPPASQPSPRSRAELMADLQKKLTNVELSGQFRGTSDLARRAPLGPPTDEKYTIVSAVPDVDDFWIFSARIQYGDHDVTVPLRLKVAWADDTPVVVVDNVNIPGIGVYSARVIFFRDYYSGTWFGPNCGGVLAGEIRRLPSP